MKFLPVIFFLCLSTICFGSEIEERAEVRALAATAFKNSDFAELERQAAEYLLNESKTESGTWKLPFFYRGIGIEGIKFENQEGSEWANAIGKFDSWAQEYPESATQYVARGNALIQRAYRFRGYGWSSGIAEQDRTNYRNLIFAAAEYLIEHAEIGSNDPHWYRSLADAYRHMGVEKSRFLEIVHEGMTRYPDYDELVFIGADYLSPKWHGSLEELEEFARASLERTMPTRGYELYARIYWAAGLVTDKKYAFQGPAANWGDMVKGMDEVIQRYPSQWNIHFFTFFSCYKPDWDVAEKYMALTEEPIVGDAWSPATNYKRCQYGIEFAPRQAGE